MEAPLQVSNFRTSAKGQIQLGRQEDLAAIATTYSLTDCSLGLTVGVVLGGVYVVDSHVQRNFHDIGVV
jgi:hypothetical protein